MVKVLTSHNHIWHPEQVAVDILKEYHTQGRVVINLNGEGPCADSIGLYKLLDYICDHSDIKAKDVTIVTNNFEEQHPHYRIKREPQHWIKSTLQAWRQHSKLAPKNFDHLFGCLYNVPSWDRLCLLSYVHRTSPHSNLLHCNGTWESDKYNTYYLDSLIDHAPSELLNVATYLQTNPGPALSDTATAKPVSAEHMMAVYPLYSKFFVDIVAETYNAGLSFFITEKTLRPMLALTPFVINAPQGYLSTLQFDYGIKTFHDWWDESYDQYQGYQRVQKIYNIIDSLNAQTPEQWRSMYQDMLPTLKHNQQQLLKYEQRR